MSTEKSEEPILWVLNLLLVIQLGLAIYGIVYALPFHGLLSIGIFSLSVWVILCMIVFLTLEPIDFGFNRFTINVVVWSGVTLVHIANEIYEWHRARKIQKEIERS
jgi:hypothetical protein